MNSHAPIYLIAFFLAFGLSIVLTPLIRRFALRYQYVCHPRNDRWHTRPVGLFGGIAIFLGMFLAWQAIAVFSGEYPKFVHPLLPVAAGGAVIFLMGLADDIRDIHPQAKLIIQVVVASVLVIFGFQVGWFESKTADLLISIFWIVGITNAFNLLDNMDGLSAGIACISGFFLFLWLVTAPGAEASAGPVLLMLSAYLGSILGFLIYNFNPASIFMGDAGSLFIGFMLACLTVMDQPVHAGKTTAFNQLSVIAVPCLILFIPILDTAFVSFMRKLFSRSVFQGGCDHSSHRMVAVGFSERKAVLILYLFAAISGSIAIGIYPMDIRISGVILVLYLILILMFWMYLANVEVYNADPGMNGRKECFSIPVITQAEYWRILFSTLFDLVLITIAYYSAYLLRFEGELGRNFDFFIKSLPIIYACQILCFFISGVYQRLWWGSRLGDLAVYIRAVTAGTVLSMLVLLFMYRFQSFSRAVFVIYWLVMLIFVSFSRFFFRIVDEWVSRGNRNGRKPALIYGAGVGGQMVVREIETNGGLGLCVIGFIDDNPVKVGKRIHGYPVLGGRNRLEEIIRKNRVKEIIVSFKRDGAETKKDIQAQCQKMGTDTVVSRMRMIIGP